MSFWNHHRKMRIIRKALPVDLDAIYAIEIEEDFPWSRALLQDCFQQEYFFDVIEGEHGIIGYIIAQMVLDECHLLHVKVAVAYQGQGYGKILLTHLLARSEALNMSAVYLEVRASNDKARQLYENIGFQEFSRRVGYYPIHEGREDAILMKLDLPRSQ